MTVKEANDAIKEFMKSGSYVAHADVVYIPKSAIASIELDDQYVYVRLIGDNSKDSDDASYKFLLVSFEIDTDHNLTGYKS